MDDFNGKFCNSGSYPLIKNSMSLLMEYMPEYYASTKPPKQSRRLHQKQSPPPPFNSPTRIFYILKDDQLSAIQTNIPKTEAVLNFKQDNQSELSRIKTVLSSLLIQQPSKFASYNLPETFNCTNKQRGFHRDPFNCAKYYYCNDNKLSLNSSVNPPSIQFASYFTEKKKEGPLVSETKTYTCPPNSIFNMEGCFCDKNLLKTSNCHYLSDTFCNDRLFKGLNYKYVV